MTNLLRMLHTIPAHNGWDRFERQFQGEAELSAAEVLHFIDQTPYYGRFTMTLMLDKVIASACKAYQFVEGSRHELGQLIDMLNEYADGVWQVDSDTISGPEKQSIATVVRGLIDRFSVMHVTDDRFNTLRDELASYYGEINMWLTAESPSASSVQFAKILLPSDGFVARPCKEKECSVQLAGSTSRIVHLATNKFVDIGYRDHTLRAHPNSLQSQKFCRRIADYIHDNSQPIAAQAKRVA